MKISFILPVLNEAPILESQLRRLQGYRAAGHEVLVIDGGSEDDTRGRAVGLADQIECSARGRSLQMNHGAQLATGEVFVFLHCDTQLPAAADKLIAQALSGDHAWGWFSVRLDNPAPPYRIISFCMNLRTRLTFVCTGDQALFVTRELFERVGGFPPIALMEDVAISKLLRRKSTPNWISRPVVTSARHWEQRGLLRTMALMWWLRLLYFVGVSPDRLQRLYYPSRRN